MSYCNIDTLQEIRNKRVLFYDLETTGIIRTPINTKPENEYPDFRDLEKYKNARIVSIGWLYMEDFDYDYDITIDNINERIIKPCNFIIPDESIKFHGITNEKANNEGKPMDKVLKKIGKLIEKSDYIIGYNIYFDINILLSELRRLRKDVTIDKILELKKEEKIVCIGQILAQNIKPKGWKKYYKYQIPKLIDSYKTCFKQELDNAHDAKFDILATIKLMFYLYSLD